MRIQTSVWQVACVAACWLGVAAGALADPPDLLRNYRFIPSKTSVHVTGGLPAYDLNLTIAGRFGLVTGYDEVISPISKLPSLEPHAEFVAVHGIIYNPLSLASVLLPGWDLDRTLNINGLHGTFSANDPNNLFFFGADGQGIALRLQATIDGGWLHLTGGSSDPAGKNPVLYQINALAHVAPFPDFNRDDAVTAADLQPMLAALSQRSPISSSSTFVDSDLASMGDVNGDGVFNNVDVQAFLEMLKTDSGLVAAVPEPTCVELLAVALPGLALAIARRRSTIEEVAR